MIQLFVGAAFVGFAADIAAWCFNSGAATQRGIQREIFAYTHDERRRERSLQRGIQADTRRSVNEQRRAANQMHWQMLQGMWEAVQDLRKRSREVKGRFKEVAGGNRKLLRTLALTPQQQAAIHECSDLLERGMARLEAYAGPYLWSFEREIQAAQGALKAGAFITPNSPEAFLPADFPYAGELLEFDASELEEFPLVDIGFGQAGRFVTPTLGAAAPEGDVTAFVQRYDRPTSRWILSAAAGALALDLKRGDAHRTPRLVSLGERSRNRRVAWWEHASGESLKMVIPEGCLSSKLRHAPVGTPVEVYVHGTDLMLKHIRVGDQVGPEHRQGTLRVGCHAPAEFWAAYTQCAAFSNNLIVRESGMQADPPDCAYILRLANGCEFPIGGSGHAHSLTLLPQCGVQLGVVREGDRSLLVYSFRGELTGAEGGETSGGELLDLVSKSFEEQRDLTRLDGMDSLELEKYDTVLRAEFETNQLRAPKMVGFTHWCAPEEAQLGEYVVAFESGERIEGGCALRLVGETQPLGWCKGTGQEDRELRVAILPGRQRQFREGSFPSRGRLELLPLEKDLQNKLSAIEAFRSSSAALTRSAQDQEAFSLLRGELLGRFEHADGAEDDGGETFSPTLDVHQERAVRLLSGSLPLVLIQGPPGTGKTHVIAHAMERILRQNPAARIALVSQANPAVNEAVAKIREFFPELLIYRDLSASAREKYEAQGAGAGLEEYYGEFVEGIRSAPFAADPGVAEVQEWLLDLVDDGGRALRMDVARARVRHSQITACTLSRLAAIAESAPPFDLVIVDEAAKASVPEALIAVNCARRLALVGDHHQLLPFMEDRFCEHSAPSAADERDLRELWNNSLFHRLWEQAPPSRKAFLAVMRRSRRPIAECVSACFYGNALIPGRDHASGSVRLPASLVWVDSSRFRHHAAGRTTLENEGEADLVVQALYEVDSLRKGPLSVAVIAFHRGQVALLNRKLKHARLSFKPTVLTVDASQGGQWDAVILSLGRTSGGSGFVGNPNRLNVAVSRAKELCIFVGSHAYATHDDTPGSLLGAVAAFVSSGPQQGRLLCQPTLGGKIPPAFGGGPTRTR